MAQVITLTTEIEAHTVPDTKPDTIIGCMKLNNRYPDILSDDICVIRLLTSPRITAQQGIATVLKLRGTYLRWAGGIVIVVDGEKARASLAEADLFGGATNSVNAIGYRNGAHRILIEPLHLTDLLTETISIGQVLRQQWREWIRNSPLENIAQLAKEVCIENSKRRYDEVKYLYSDLLRLWRKVDWLGICFHDRIQRLALSISKAQKPSCIQDINEKMVKITEVLRDIGYGDI